MTKGHFGNSRLPLPDVRRLSFKESKISEGGAPSYRVAVLFLSKTNRPIPVLPLDSDTQSWWPVTITWGLLKSPDAWALILVPSYSVDWGRSPNVGVFSSHPYNSTAHPG